MEDEEQEEDEKRRRMRRGRMTMRRRRRRRRRRRFNNSRVWRSQQLPRLGSGRADPHSDGRVRDGLIHGQGLGRV